MLIFMGHRSTAKASNRSTQAMMEGVDNSNNFVIVLSEGYFQSSYAVMEVRRALEMRKNIILCHAEGLNVGAALKPARV